MSESSSSDNITPAASATVAVIGGGAAGLTAALFLARAGLKVHLFDQDRSILKRARLQNLPGQEDYEGRDLLASLRAKIDGAGVQRHDGRVEDVVPTGSTPPSFAVSSGGSALQADFVVVATGQGNLRLGSLPLETTTARQPFVKTNVVTDRWGAASVPGVYAAGVVAGWPSQAVVCAGSGANVAIEIASAVRGDFWVDHDDSRLPTDTE